MAPKNLGQGPGCSLRAPFATDTELSCCFPGIFQAWKKHSSDSLERLRDVGSRERREDPCFAHPQLPGPIRSCRRTERFWSLTLAS